MIEVNLRYDGGGKFSAASHIDFRFLSDECDPGEQLLARLVRPRSNRENRLFHGVVKSAYDNQRGGPLFTEEEGGWLKLRAWLLCEAGHCDLHEFAHGSITEPVIRTLKQVYDHGFWSANRRTGVVRLRIAKSISFRLLKSDDFQPIKNKIFEIICTDIVPGTTPEQLMEIRHVGEAQSRETRTPASRQQERADRSEANAG